ncbi:MAG: hypothetical protein IKG42_06680 [Clostridia bacterium]|nr:hypothetical protein [Clostridia bacterium]
MQLDTKLLNEINQEIDDLKQRINELKKEINMLEQKKKDIFETREVLDSIPATVRNALKHVDIVTDYQFFDFLEGRYRPDYCGGSDYEKADTRKGRLKSLRNVGEGLADQTIEILEKINF